MTRFLRLLRRYPVIAATVLAGAVVLILDTTGQATVARVLATAYVSAVIVWTLIGMIRDVLRGHVGLDVLAVVAMVATLAVGEYVAALIIVLMLSGGEALEDYAGRMRSSSPTATSRPTTSPSATNFSSDRPRSSPWTANSSATRGASTNRPSRARAFR